DVVRGGAPRDAWNMAWVDPDSPIFHGLTDPPSLYRSVLVYRTMGIRPEGGSGSGSGNVDAEGVRTLARLDDDTPLLIRRSVGSRGGQTYLWTGGFQIGWTNLPLRKIFPAMILRIVSEDLATSESAPTGIYCGVPVRRETIVSEASKFVEIQPPRGGKLRFPMDAVTTATPETDTTTTATSDSTPIAARSDIQSYTFTQTGTPGFWSFRTLGTVDPDPMTVAVNIDPSLTYPQTLSGEFLEQILAPDPVIYSGSAQEIGENLRKLREGTNLEDPLLYAVFLALVAEAFVANRRGGREEEPMKGSSPISRTIRAKDLSIREF
ncbi:MAG: hypothetical protein Q4C47_09500, partial [Planctomycetia bacterium]|nr:hypothetical protein [Planctomycetia bacterium]